MVWAFIVFLVLLMIGVDYTLLMLKCIFEILHIQILSVYYWFSLKFNPDNAKEDKEDYQED